MGRENRNKNIKMYLAIPYKITYDTDRFSFRDIVTRMMECEVNLEDIHKIKNYKKLIREKDQSTIWHKKYYSNFEKQFKNTYIDLIKELKDSFNYKQLIYQKIPTFRVQLAEGNVGVGEWHKDKTYNHGISEVNFWLPFTDTNEFNSVWIESKEDKSDYRPYLVKYGEILVFDGANLMHGNKENISNSTRVSMDFRLVDPYKFIPNSNGSINTKSKFTVGEYFEII